MNLNSGAPRLGYNDINDDLNSTLMSNIKLKPKDKLLISIQLEQVSRTAEHSSSLWANDVAFNIAERPKNNTAQRARNMEIIYSTTINPDF